MSAIRLRLWIDGVLTKHNILVAYVDVNDAKPIVDAMIKIFGTSLGKKNIFDLLKSEKSKTEGPNCLEVIIERRSDGMRLDDIRRAMFNEIKAIAPINTSYYPATGGLSPMFIDMSRDSTFIGGTDITVTIG